MCKEKIIFMVAGLLVLSGVVLGHFVSPWFLILAAFPGVNMIIAAFTGFCPFTKILNAMKVERCTANSPLD